MSTTDGSMARLLQVMRRLRDPQGGCPWDLEQTFATIAPYTIEEAYEVADAIESGDSRKLREELGDLLFQVVFHSQLAHERGWFDFEAVAAAIADKLERRHPHVFAGATVRDAAEQTAAWEAMKAAERGQRADASRVADVPRALPALTRACKLGRRAAAVNFDFDGAPAARAKIDEELAELDQATGSGGGGSEAAEELGDLLLAVVNWARHLELDPEESLRASNAKFERRFRFMETLALERGIDLTHLDAEGWDVLWRAAKAL
ncbi:MAG: nucleoside triphosphate pyrophosphohydrolase [Steroidobacteraceae bacterium]